MSKSIPPVLVAESVSNDGEWPAANSYNATVDIRAFVCPMTFVRTRLALDRLSNGQVLRVILTGEEPRINVPRSATELGHAILQEQTSSAGITTLLIRKQFRD